MMSDKKSSWKGSINKLEILTSEIWTDILNDLII